jgi:hypothetical protein
MVAEVTEGRHQVAYGDEQIVFTLRRQPARVVPRIAIHVEPDGRVEVDAPPNAPRSTRWTWRRLVCIPRGHMPTRSAPSRVHWSSRVGMLASFACSMSA